MKPVYAGAAAPATNDPDAVRARATAIRRARAIRARSLRRRVIAGALALFVAVWLLIAVALVTGHDPALAAKRTTTVASAPATTSTSSTGTSSTGTNSSSAGNSSATSSVSTRQS